MVTACLGGITLYASDMGPAKTFEMRKKLEEAKRQVLVGSYVAVGLAALSVLYDVYIASGANGEEDDLAREKRKIMDNLDMASPIQPPLTGDGTER